MDMTRLRRPSKSFLQNIYLMLELLHYNVDGSIFEKISLTREKEF